MAKANHDDAQVKKQGEAARKEAIEQQKALEVAAGVRKGAELVRALELKGEKHFTTLTLNPEGFDHQRRP